MMTEFVWVIYPCKQGRNHGIDIGGGGGGVQKGYNQGS